MMMMIDSNITRSTYIMHIVHVRCTTSRSIGLTLPPTTRNHILCNGDPTVFKQRERREPRTQDSGMLFYTIEIEVSRRPVVKRLVHYLPSSIKIFIIYNK